MNLANAQTGWRFRRAKALIATLISVVCVAPPVRAQGIQPIVAIHDSELTRALESTAATPPTPSGSGTTSFEWWPTDWHYFVMPESVKEALRSDGTAFTVIGDSSITAGLLLPDGAPKYPILISLAAEAIQDSEIPQLTNYVAAGGFLLVGSSSFSRNPNGTTRGDFAFANELGVHMVVPGLTNWGFNRTLTRSSSHRLVSHLPEEQLNWRMPSHSEEISWGISPSHQFLAPHDVWQVKAGDATVLAQGDIYPYVLVKPYGKGCFIYYAPMQPLIGHGGFAPGMYAYVIFRRAIEWAFESARLPVPRLSPWPYAYDAAFMVRHDLEDFPNEIADLEASAQYEYSVGAKGDYYFCTGTLRQDMAGSYNTNAVVASLQRAIRNYGATIGPHNGGLRNPDNPALVETDYDYWHWGLDEVLDASPSGYANGKAYALASLSNSFLDIESWLPGLMTSGMRAWVSPSFNATREDSYDIQEQLGVKIAGEQKLTPFPHWTLSTQTSGKQYAFLSEPVSDWFVGGLVAQSLEPWHPPGVETSQTMHTGVDFYYSLGALINFYSHTLSTGEGDAGQLVPDYITYCMNTNLHPRLWSANAMSVYQWWLQRSGVQIACNSTNTAEGVLSTTMSITGAKDVDTAVEFVLPEMALVSGLQVFANGSPAGRDTYRTNGQALKLLTGTSVANAEIRYTLLPRARDDFYVMPEGGTLTVEGAGVLSNDRAGSRGGALTAVLANGPAHGALTLNADGSFSYTPTNNFAGTDTFVYQASDGMNSSPPATVSIMITPPGVLFADDFTSSGDPGPLAPWVAQLGAWSVTAGQLEGGSPANNYGIAYFNDDNWTDYTVQARIQFSSTNGLGGGIGGRLNPATGTRYAAWVYPEGSQGGSAMLKLIKFEGWESWTGGPMQSASLPALGTNWHTLTLTFQGANIIVYFDGVQQINISDNNFDSVAAYTKGGISVDMYTAATPYTLAVDDVIVSTSAAPPVITSQPASATANAGSTVSFTVAASGAAPLSYQWFKNGTNKLADGGSLSGSTTASLTLAKVSDADGGGYAVVVSNPAGSATSSSATLRIVDAPVIVSQPASQTNTAGTTATFTVAARGAALNYQWRFNGAEIQGATASSYTRSNVRQADAGNYTVAVSNTAGSVVSSPATLTVIAPAPPAIVTQPQSQTVIAGQSTSFSVSATGTEPLGYHWRFNGADIPGATGATYTITSAQAGNAGTYTVLVTNNYGAVTSHPATLTVNYSLTVTSTSGGSVAMLPSRSAYAPGSTVVLTAAPAPGFLFSGWSGSVNSTSDPLILTMTGNMVIKATFTPIRILPGLSNPL